MKFLYLVQNFSDKEWELLNKALESLKPVSGLFENDRRIYHYLERVYSYVTRSSDREICQLVYRQIEELFPNVKLIFNDDPGCSLVWF